jgi:hypothetical protein
LSQQHDTEESLVDRNDIGSRNKKPAVTTGRCEPGSSLELINDDAEPATVNHRFYVPSSALPVEGKRKPVHGAKSYDREASPGVLIV